MKEGFWFSKNDPELPMPKAKAEPASNQELVLERLAHAESRAHVSAYRGFSCCRICGCRNGHEEFEFKGWTWPSGLRHYVKVHNVRLSPEFKKFLGVEQ